MVGSPRLYQSRWEVGDAPEETGEGAMHRLITHSIRSLMDHTSTMFQHRVPGPRQIEKYLKLCILETLWPAPLARLPSHVSLYIP